MSQSVRSRFARLTERHGARVALGVAVAATTLALPQVALIFVPGVADAPKARRLRAPASAPVAERLAAAVGRTADAAHIAAAGLASRPARASIGASLATTGSWYAYAAASDPDAVPYDLSFVRAGVSVVGSALGAWLTLRRSPLALPVVFGSGLGSLALGVANERLHGTHVTRSWEPSAVRDALFNRALPVFQGAAQVVQVAGLVGERALLRRGGAALPPQTAPLLSWAGYPLVRKLALYYMTFAILGHWGEILFCLGIKHGIFQGGYDRTNHMLWDQWLYPFPAEGTAAVLIVLALYPATVAVRRVASGLALAGRIHPLLAQPLALVASFLLNQVACTAIDYSTGMVANRNYELWDYRDMPFNFQGQVCLQNSLFYSVVATWACWGLIPHTEAALAAAGDTLLDGTLVGFGSFFVFLELLYHVLPKDFASARDALRAWARRMLANLSTNAIAADLQADEGLAPADGGLPHEPGTPE